MTGDRRQRTGILCFFRQESVQKSVQKPGQKSSQKSSQNPRLIHGQSMPFFLLVCLIIGGCTAFPQSDREKQMLSGADSAAPGSERSFSPTAFFQKYISPIDGNRCPMYPSCSAYSMEAIRKYGVIKGWIMTCDRLLRCGRDECRLAPRVIIMGEAYCHDPVSENDFRTDTPKMRENGF